MLRSELFEYISQVAKKAFAADKSHVALADLERIVAVALLPTSRTTSKPCSGTCIRSRIATGSWTR